MQYGDLVRFCDFGYTAGVARVVGAALWSLANAPGSPQSVVIDTSELTNSTTLRWQRGNEPDLAGYEVVYRETTASEWEHAIDVGDVDGGHVGHLEGQRVLRGPRRRHPWAPQPGCLPAAGQRLTAAG